MPKIDQRAVLLALLMTTLITACGRDSATPGAITVEELNIEPAKYAGKHVAIDCRSASFVASEGAFGGFCRTEGGDNALTLPIELSGLDADTMRQLMKECGKECRATITGVYAKTVIDTYVLVFQSIDVGGYRVEKSAPKALLSYAEGKSRVSLEACRELAEETRATLAAQGAEGVEVAGYYDKNGNRCLQRKRFIFPAGYPLEGTMELSLYVGSNEDDWLAKCSDVAASCYIGNEQVFYEEDRAQAVARTENYIREVVQSMELASDTGSDTVDRAERDAIEAAEAAATEAAEAADAANLEAEAEALPLEAAEAASEAERAGTE